MDKLNEILFPFGCHHFMLLFCGSTQIIKYEAWNLLNKSQRWRLFIFTSLLQSNNAQAPTMETYITLFGFVLLRKNNYFLEKVLSQLFTSGSSQSIIIWWALLIIACKTTQVTNKHICYCIVTHSHNLIVTRLRMFVFDLNHKLYLTLLMKITGHH